MKLENYVLLHLVKLVVHEKKRRMKLFHCFNISVEFNLDYYKLYLIISNNLVFQFTVLSVFPNKSIADTFEIAIYILNLFLHIMFLKTD